MKHDIVSIGDATLDTYLMIKEASVLCNVKKDACVLCLSYADKIAVGRPERCPGGNAANNAVGSARLGLKAALYSVLGDDETGRNIRGRLDKEGVATKYVALQKGGETNTAFILNYQAERTILVYHADRAYQLPKLGDAKWVYLTSLGHGHLGVHADLLAWLKGRDTKLAFNPGTHQLKDGLESLKPVLERADILFVNKEEAKKLAGDIADTRELLAAVRGLGPKTAVITDGNRGSFAYDGREFWRCGTTDAPVVERTGAGDAFATGFLAATFHGRTVLEALRWGTLNSSSVIGQVGPQAGLLDLKQMEATLEKYSSLKAERL